MHISRQAFIEAVDDDFLIAGIITLIGGIPVLLLRGKKQKGAANSHAPPGSFPGNDQPVTTE
jgi:hypothetical protein